MRGNERERVTVGREWERTGLNDRAAREGQTDGSGDKGKRGSGKVELTYAGNV